MSIEYSLSMASEEMILLYVYRGQNSTDSHVVAELVKQLQINLLRYTEEGHVVHTNSI